MNFQFQVVWRSLSKDQNQGNQETQISYIQQKHECLTLSFKMYFEVSVTQMSQARKEKHCFANWQSRSCIFHLLCHPCYFKIDCPLSHLTKFWVQLVKYCSLVVSTEAFCFLSTILWRWGILLRRNSFGKNMMSPARWTAGT